MNEADAVALIFGVTLRADNFDHGRVRPPLFLVADGDWHLAPAGFIPSAWGAQTVRAVCGVVVRAIGSSNYSPRPCQACLERGMDAIKTFYRKRIKAC